MEIEEIISLFAISGSLGQVSPFGSGHIHNTFLVKNARMDSPDYLLQQINNTVFKDIDGMMSNIRKVTAHLENRLSQTDIEKGYRSLRLVPARDGNSYVQANGNFWRMYYFLDGLFSFDILTLTAQIEEAGRGFGRFLTMLADLPPDELVITIPGFHYVSLRIDQLQEANKQTHRDHEGWFTKAMDMAPVMIALDERAVPLRVSHNDTKCNNLMFDARGKAVCVVDLDTVMPGKVWYDIGDSLRTLITDAEEDADATPAVFPDRFDAYVRGYLQETREVLTEEEITCIPMSGAYMAYIMGIRFLADYLNGDVYYKTSYDGQNLRRARNQLRLAQGIIDKQDELEKRLSKILSTGA